MDKLIYKRAQDTHLFVATDSSPYWTAFLPQELANEDVESISFGDTPQYGGFYLFGDKTPSDYTQLWTKLSGYLFPMQSLQCGGIVWIKNVESDMNDKNVVLIRLQKSGDSYIMLSSFSMNIGNGFATLSVSASGNMSVKLDIQNNRFLFSSSSLSNTTISLTTNQNDSVSTNGKLEISAYGQLMGSIRFLASSIPNDFFSTLDTAAKFAFHDENGNCQEINSPMFYDPTNERIKLQISIHPLDLLNETHLDTYIAFLCTSQSGSEEKKTVLNSYYRSDYNIPVSLMPEPQFDTYEGYENIPQASSPILVFSEREKGSTDKRWYTVPSGRFRMLTNDSWKIYLGEDGRIRLLCGLSGTETISVSTGDLEGGGDYMEFLPGQPAHAARFPIETVHNKVGDNVTVKEMDDSFLTVWVGFSRSEASTTPIIYNSQPQANPLFVPDADNASGETSILFMDFYPTNSGELDNAQGSAFFPMLTYSSKTVAAFKIDVTEFERQIILPTRKLRIGAAMNRQAEKGTRKRTDLRDGNTKAALTDTVTPQGFLVKVDTESGTWTSVRLARSQYKNNNGTISPDYVLEFQELTTGMQNALQTDQLFLVVSSDKDNVLGKFKNEMQMDGWPFVIDVAKETESHNGQYENVLIFKYCNRALSECVRNIQFWTLPEIFNNTDSNGLANLSDWLTEYIEDGIHKFESGDADYYKFWNIATDPAWKGVIVLKVNISLTTFPAELQGLLAGINLNEFYAHHFGIDASTMKQEGGNIAMSLNSSMFALIDYEDDTFRMLGGDIEKYKAEVTINTDVDYEFKVLLLKIMFANSSITDYHSYIALTVNRLFGEKVKDDNRENLLILNGTYENQDGTPSYTFSVEGDNLMELDSCVIRSAEITKAGFVTAVSKDEGDAGKVESSFSLSGFLDFRALEGFDLFSFGNEGDESRNHCGLAFSNIRITLCFPVDNPTQQVYGFVTDQASFDLGASYARKGSLYNHFPLQITSFVAGTPDDTPSIRGFLNVELTSLVRQQSISDYWHGLIFKLNMGSSGTLASNAGFDAQFIMAWNAGGTGAAAYLKLPGMNAQAPALSLQGVLRLNFKSIRLCVADDGVSYLMKLDDIALKFLGLSFPNKGKVGLFLFGNPSEREMSGSSLGWYGGYKKK